MIGICRSGRFILARLFDTSPLVAMRVAWLMAAVVTPSSAARSGRGRTTSSGCTRLALVLTFEKPGTARSSRSICAAAAASAFESSPVISSCNPPPPKLPPPAENLAPGMSRIIPRNSRCSCCCCFSRSFLSTSTMPMLALRVLTMAQMRVMFWLSFRRSRTASTTARVSCSREPGGRLALMLKKPLSGGGRRPVGRVEAM